MLTFLLAAQLAAAQKPADTATYSSAALRTLVAEAVLMNNRVPAGLGGYHAKLESEIGIGERDGGGHEAEESIEEVASDLAWRRTGEFEQHIVGYRAQALGLQLATIGFFRNAWVVPSLYGNRLSLLFGIDTSRQGRNGRPPAVNGRTSERVSARSSLVAMHPLSVDRERFYRYSGGDTVEHLKVGNRDIRIVRIEVEPQAKLPFRTVVFTGEIDLDADRKHVVRMRGSFVATAQEPPGALESALSSVRPTGIAYVELVNSEVNGEYWLPSYQRFEAQGMFPVMGDAKAVFRIVSRFGDYVITPPDSTAVLARRTAPDTGASNPAAERVTIDDLRARPHILTIAPWDSLAAFRAWHDEIGAATAGVSTEDFMDVAPLSWRANGPPEFTLQAERFSDLIQYNRIEGLYTGLGVAERMRDAAPGLTLRAVGGYAWNERTARGRTSAELVRGAWTYALRAGRSLDITNDFRDPLDSGSTLGALVGTDDYDYVDRYSAGVAVTRAFEKSGPQTGLQARLEAGWADDRAVSNTLSENPFHTSYRANRGVDQGNYLRTAFTLSWNADASAEYLRPGVGAMISYLRGDGQLNFQRVEGRVSTRYNAGRWTFAARLDGGLVLGNPPPQQLFEMGSVESLPGYGYKQFAGNQAALFRALAMYRLNALTAPIRVTRLYWLPALAPALALTAESGWTGASDPAAQASILRLGETAGQPLSTVTGNARATVAAGIRLFGGALGASMARAVDRPDRWRAQFDFGQSF
jgi:hypothetical protein